MVAPLRVLIVEDQTNDVELLVHALHKQGFDPQWERVETEADCLAKLDPSLDLIIADHDVPQFSALRTLDLLKERGLDIPFIIVSGTTDEGTAAVAMKAGARDFILKDNLTRLSLVVERELREAKQHRDRGTLAAPGEVLDAFFCGSPAGMAVLDSDLRFMQINQTLAKINGASVRDHLGKTVREVLPKLAPTLEPLVRRALESGQTISSVEVSGEVPTQPGVVRHWIVSYFPIPRAAGSRIDVGVVVVEITERKQAEEALRASEERFRELTENIHEVFWMSDLETNQILYVSPAYEKVWGRTCQSVYDNPMSFLDGIHPEDRDGTLKALKVQKKHGRFQSEYRVIRPDGSTSWIFDRGFPIRNAAGELVRVAGIAEDITERKRAEKSLALFRALIDHTTDSIEVVDPETGRFLDVNERACRDHGYSREEFLQLSVRDVEAMIDLFSEDAWRTIVENIRTQGSQIVEGAHRRKDGSVFPVEINTTYIRLDRDYLVAVVRDISGRKRAEVERDGLFKRVKQTRDRLRLTSLWLVEAQEAERRRIARELHDEIGQTLMALKMSLHLSEQEPATAKQSIGKAQRCVDDLLARVRRISLDLRPAMLDDLGLLPALLWHFERFSATTAVHVDFQHSGLENRRFPHGIETAIYRVVQEALTNVSRHAAVTSATVRVWADLGTIGAQIADLGKGFDSTAALSTAISSGLSGMRERVGLLGGEFVIESAPGRGTRLNMSLPVDGGEAK